MTVDVADLQAALVEAEAALLGSCPVKSLLIEFHPDATDWLQGVLDGVSPPDAVAAALAACGFPVSSNAVHAHRMLRCPCALDLMGA